MGADLFNIVRLFRRLPRANTLALFVELVQSAGDRVRKENFFNWFYFTQNFGSCRLFSCHLSFLKTSELQDSSLAH